MKKPVIGITTTSDKNKQGYAAVILLRAYVDAILTSGGLPLLIPNGLAGSSFEQVFDIVDGILFTGGGDISADRYEGTRHRKMYKMDGERDQLELALMGQAIERDFPFLGICRGMQILNVCAGGSLFTHIADQKADALKHDHYPKIPRSYLAHEVAVLPDSRLGKTLEVNKVSVNSLHHQGVDRLGKNLLAVAEAPDGLVEGLEVPAHRFGMAVQWHPEWLMEHEPARKLFTAFIQGAGRSRQK